MKNITILFLFLISHLVYPQDNSNSLVPILIAPGTFTTIGEVIKTEAPNLVWRKFNNTNWLDIKIISSGSHFRTMINGKMILHGHGDVVNPGTVGIKFNGTGSLLLSSLEVEVIEE